jgi:MFS transporter, DHA2 family, multidrug resistance protein
LPKEEQKRKRGAIPAHMLNGKLAWGILFCFGSPFLGLLVFGLAFFDMTGLVLQIDFRTLMLWRVFLASGMAFLFVPVNTIAYTDMPPEASNQVSAMTNLMRNIGGSIGISAVTTLLARRQQVHQGYLAHNTFQYGPYFQHSLAQLPNRIGARTGAAQATRQAYGVIYHQLQQQASVLAYIDIFRISGMVCLGAVLFLFFAKKRKPGQATMGH